MSDCTLFEEHLLQDIRLLGDGPEVINILNGSYVPPEGMPWATKRWLQHMHNSHPLTTSLEEYKKNWNKSNKKTSLGDPHMGHFKAAEIKKLGWLNFIMAVLPYIAGYAPKRWQKGTDVMLPKKEELFLLTKLGL